MINPSPAERAKKERRKSRPGGPAKLLNLPRNWLHQGLRYMDRTEFRVRILIEAGLMVLFCFALSAAVKAPPSNKWVILISAVTVHTLEWLLNGNWWGLILFTFPGMRNAGEQATCRYMARMAARLRSHPSIGAIAIYGSAARGQWHTRSDLDVRLLREPGFLNGLAATLLTMRERIMAFAARQPIDLFLADGAAFLEKMRADEPPIIILKRGPFAARALPGQEEPLTDHWPPRGRAHETAGPVKN